MRAPRAPIMAALVLVPGAASAHFAMLLAQKPSVRRGETAEIRYMVGHPFEHVLADAKPPACFEVIAPSGKRTDLLPQLEVHRTKGGGARIYTAPYTPTERGDALVCTETEPHLHGAALMQGFAKMVLHVQTQNGWERRAGHPLELVPLTRPYGIEAGTTVRVQLLKDGEPLEGVALEVERYMPEPPPEELWPPDEFITRVERTGPGGVAGVTLTEPGWWVVGAEVEAGTAEHAGERYPLHLRAMLWVFVGRW